MDEHLNLNRSIAVVGTNTSMNAALPLPDYVFTQSIDESETIISGLGDIVVESRDGVVQRATKFSNSRKALQYSLDLLNKNKNPNSTSVSINENMAISSTEDIRLVCAGFDEAYTSNSEFILLMKQNGKLPKEESA